MRAAARQLRRRLGRRGALLTMKGTIASLYGYGQIVEPLRDQRGLCLLLKLWPLQVWGWAWIVAGLIALTCAWLPPRRDWPGFVAVWAITAPWSMSYLAAWWPLDEYPRGWVAALIFGAFGAVCLIAIGWDEPPRRTEPERGT
ncbi:hypothetical protein [Streptomyces pseudovenezuelae]|uniref:hypothetical protein n=1 Tax=Streptomyces pseudovenezuelae TaxID=67350 RepID=UPI002E362764|nr:hypothetical protein [Streptomyces pseudovenezuelae]